MKCVCLNNEKYFPINSDELYYSCLIHTNRNSTRPTLKEKGASPKARPYADLTIDESQS